MTAKTFEIDAVFSFAGYEERMMTMRVRIRGICLVLALLLSLAACSGEESSTRPPIPETQAEMQETDELVVYLPMSGPVRTLFEEAALPYLKGETTLEECMSKLRSKLEIYVSE